MANKLFPLSTEGGNMTLGENIRKYRKELKLTQAELAKRIGVRQHHVTRWEKGTYTPSIENLKELSKALGISVDGLLFTARERKHLKISDKELLDKLMDIDKLTPEDRTTIVNLIETFKTKLNNLQFQPRKISQNSKIFNFS